MNRVFFLLVLLFFMILAFLGGYYVKDFFGKQLSTSAMNSNTGFVFPIDTNNNSISELSMTYAIKGTVENVSTNANGMSIVIQDKNNHELGTFKLKNDAFVTLNSKKISLDDIKKGQIILNANIFYVLDNKKIVDAYIPYISLQ